MNSTSREIFDFQFFFFFYIPENPLYSLGYLKIHSSRSYYSSVQTFSNNTYIYILPRRGGRIFIKLDFVKKFANWEDGKTFISRTRKYIRIDSRVPFKKYQLFWRRKKKKKKKFYEKISSFPPRRA